MKACCALTRWHDGKRLPQRRTCRAPATEKVGGRFYCAQHANKARSALVARPVTRH